jgi:ribosomal protein S18 acetylase RimI-like enzyme
MRLTIRHGDPADASALASFAARTFRDTYEASNTPDDMRGYLAGAFGPEQQARELSDPAMITVIAERDDGIVGYAQVRRHGAPPCVSHEMPAEIYRFYVDAPAHGTGVAQRLMEAALDAARQLGARHAWLGVWERNGRGIAFYRKSGFREVGTQYFQLGADRQRDLVLERPLRSFPTGL